MNAVEIESAISDLAFQPFNAAEFPFEFLAAFGNKDTAIKRLRTGNNNASDVPDGGSRATTSTSFTPSDDGNTRINLRVEGDSIWLSQLEITALFQTTRQNASLYAKNIFEEGEMSQAATVKESLTVQTEGSRQVQRAIISCNLD